MNKPREYRADTAIFDGRLRQAQLKMLAMLEVLDKICQKHNIEYWLDAGTLLGAVRHQGFIPWDDDMDIAMPRESFEKFLRLAPAELPDSIWLQTPHSDPGFYNMATPLKIRDRNSRLIETHEKGNEPYVQGIFIDVFVYDGMPTNTIKRRFNKFIARKISRCLCTKYSNVGGGRHASFYKKIGHLLPKSLLENRINKMVERSNKKYKTHIGRGYHCKRSNFLAREDVFPLKRAQFETAEFNIPHRAEYLLSLFYGDYQKLPPEGERTLRHCVELIPDLSGQFSSN